ncbi:MAG: DMT family protein [Planctomycetota bacterium]
MGIVFVPVMMLVASNIFMTFAWYGHLKDLKDRPWLVAALVSWGIALFEYLIQVPANRLGSSMLTLPQLKIIQEVVTLCVFVPFVVVYMKQSLRWDFLWAALCLCGAVYFIFREGFQSPAN